MRDLCQHIMDLVENAVAAGAGRISVVVSEAAECDQLLLRVEDDGCGIPAALAAQVIDPFCTTRTTRRMGLGLSLLEATARRAGGKLAIRSAPEAGTCVECSLLLSHLDTPPLGDVVETLVTLVAVHSNLDLSYEHQAGRRTFRMDLAEMRGAFNFSHPASIGALRRQLTAQWEDFCGKVELVASG